MILRRRSLPILVTLMILVMTGCLGSGSHPRSGNEDGLSNNGSGAGAADKVTIKFMHLWPEGTSASQYKVVNQIIHNYQTDNPNVTIKTEVLDNEPYKNKLKVISTSNQLPDVGVTWAAGFMRPYVEGGLFTPLDDVLSGGLQDEFLPGTTEAYAFDGQTYALPLEFNVAPIYYNKEIFRRYRLEIPETYDELMHIIQTLNEHGIAPIALGNRERWTGSLWYMYLAERFAGQETLASAIQGETSFGEENLLRAAEEVQTLVWENAFVQGFNGLSNEEAKLHFINEQAAMYLMGSWDLPNFTTNDNIPQEFRDKVGFFKFPIVEDGKGDHNSWVGGPGVGLFVAENSAVKEEAKRFVQYFIEQWGEQAVTGAGIIPATKVDRSTSDLPQLYIDLFNEIDHASSFTLFVDVQMESTDADVHLNQIQALFGNAVTPRMFANSHDMALYKYR